MTLTNFIHKATKAICNPSYTLYKIVRGLSSLFSDSIYIKLTYFLQNGACLNLKTPKTFNEKLNWLKIHDHNPLYTLLADKYEVKDYVAQKIGKEFVVPSIGVWNKFEDIDFDSLPDEFVLKATHNSGGITICHDKKLLDLNKLNYDFNTILNTNWYYTSHEWVYRDIPPRIIADTLLKTKTSSEIKDYKFWCFNGKPRIMYITNKGENISENFYDMNFMPLDINHGFPRSVPEYERPAEFDLMKQLAEKLAQDIPFVRIDFFDIDGQVYFGEYTFYDWGGMRAFATKDMDIMLGNWIDISSVKQQ